MGVAAVSPIRTFVSSTGVPLALGSVTVYVAGSTTPTNTWQDEGLTSLNDWPVPLDAAGRATIWLDPNVVYDFLIKNAAGVTQYTEEDVSGAEQSDLRALLAASSGSSLVGFMPAGSGATTQTIEARLRKVPHTSDYSTNANYVAAVNLLAANRHTTADGAVIHRFADRVFMGEAAGKFYGDSLTSDSGTSWFQKPGYPAYLGINAGVLYTNNDRTKYGIVSAVRTSNNASSQVIGFGSAVVNDTASANAWGFIAEIQHETGSSSIGLEIGAKNSSAVVTNAKTPYTNAGGVFGLWAAGGGDNAFGPVSTQPSNTALVVLKNSQPWKRGIVFTSDGIDGTDGSAVSVTNGVAINLARRHLIQWNDPTNDVMGASITSTVTTSASSVQMVMADAQIQFLGPASVDAFYITAVASAVNFPSVRSAIAGAPVRLEANGTDANIDIWINPKGTGVLRVGTWTSNADAAVNGYVTIKDSAGSTRKLATIA